MATILFRSIEAGNWLLNKPLRALLLYKRKQKGTGFEGKDRGNAIIQYFPVDRNKSTGSDVRWAALVYDLNRCHCDVQGLYCKTNISMTMCTIESEVVEECAGAVETPVVDDMCPIPLVVSCTSVINNSCGLYNTKAYHVLAPCHRRNKVCKMSCTTGVADRGFGIDITMLETEAVISSILSPFHVPVASARHTSIPTKCDRKS